MKSIRDLLSGRAAITVALTASVLDAVKLMGKERVGAILVVSDRGELEGVFTERDLMTRVVVPGRNPAKVEIREVMTEDLFTAAPEARINEMSRELTQRHIRHLPVIENDTVIGMLSLRDLLAAHLDAKRHEVQALTAYIQGEGDAPPPTGET